MQVLMAYIGVILIWSTTPLAIQWSSIGVGFVFAITVRMLIGAVLSYAWMRFEGQRLSFSRSALQLYMASVMGAFGAMMATYWASQYIPSGLMSVLFGLSPMFAGVFSYFLLGERLMVVNKLLGTAIGLLGLLVIFRDDLYLGDKGMLGIMGMLLAVTLYSVSTVLIKRIGTALPAVVMNTGGLLATLPFFLLAWLVSGQAWPVEIPARSLMSIVYLGVFGSFAGFVMYFYVLKHLPAGSVMLITLVTPVLALMLGAWLNAEVLSSSVWMGAVLVLLGVLSYEWSAISQFIYTQWKK